MVTVAFIPVRGGSRSIPGKNVRNLAGRPLLHWSLQAAIDCEGIDKVVVSSDSEEILAVARQIESPKLQTLERPAHLATDTATTESAMLHFAESESFDRFLLIQATSPLTSTQDLAGALAKMDETGADSLLSGTREHRFRWAPGESATVQAENYVPEKRPRRQDWEGELMENGAFYITSREQLLKTGCRLSGRVAFWEMSRATAIEIDDEQDWELLELLVARHGTPDLRRRASRIKLVVTDVDGVLTDGGMYYGPEGEALKKFNTRDGMGIRLFREAGGEVVIITGENSPSVAQRAQKLKLDKVHLGISDKLPVLERVAAEHQLSMEEIAYIGDDLNDLEALSRVGFAGAPKDATQTIRAAAHYICSARGGEGCVREFIDFILRNRA